MTFRFYYDSYASQSIRYNKGENALEERKSLAFISEQNMTAGVCPCQDEVNICFLFEPRHDVAVFHPAPYCGHLTLGETV